MPGTLTLFSCASGAVWAGSGLALFAWLTDVPRYRFFAVNLPLFVVLGALVGGLAGRALRRLARPGVLGSSLLSFGTLIATTLLFWMLVGAAWDLLDAPLRGRVRMRAVVQLPFWSVIVLCQTGLILALAPLAYVNHRLFFSIREHDDSARGSAHTRLGRLA